MPGRSLAYVLGYIEDDNEPRLQDPPCTAPLRRGWMPRRMSASLSSSSGASRSVGASRSTGSVPRTPLARVKDEPVDEPPQTRSSRGIVIREPGEAAC